MKLGLSYQELAEAFSIAVEPFSWKIETVSIDTRKIHDGAQTLFIAMKGEFRDGHDFINTAYQKGVRTFLVDHLPTGNYPEAIFLKVDETLGALQQLARYHRSKFDVKVVAITGSAGKTIVKEWLGQVLSKHFNVVRSPKSYNSQIGVALSLLEIREEAEIAIIEAGISKPGEMEVLERMIQPDLGILTSIGTSHRENFSGQDQQLAEKMKLFEHAGKVIIHDSIPVIASDRIIIVGNHRFTFLDQLRFNDNVSKANAALVVAAALELGMTSESIAEDLPNLQKLAMRLETFEGVKGSLVINDTYSLDIDAFRSSLEYQLAISNGRKRIVLVGLSDISEADSIRELVREFDPIELYFVDVDDPVIDDVDDAVVLIKGNRSIGMERYASRYKQSKHNTFVEISLSAIRDNIMYIKGRLPEESKILSMVKASSYGSGGEKMALYLERIGINMFGVAYADEGIQLRKAGVKIPILVMNVEESSFADCINYKLEPSIYSIEQLEAFIKALIEQQKSAYPIHLKVETGMNRLGFTEDKIKELISLLQVQPEVHVKSIYSHLATADDPESDFVHEQAQRFNRISESIGDALPYRFDRHLLNSEGALNFPQYHYDLVRLGIGMYGYSPSAEHSKNLRSAIRWYSRVSQLKRVKEGDSIGYGRSSVANRDMTIAIIPVGYADGFRRSLSNGKAGVYINNEYCPVVGRVCMDMIMVDIGELKIKTGELVEIIGVHQSLEDLAEKMGTIPYEVMTGISPRVHRVYIED